MGQDGDCWREALISVLKAVSRVEVSTSKNGAWSDGINLWVWQIWRKMQRESWLRTVSSVDMLLCWLWGKVFGCSCYSKMMVEDADRPCTGNRGRKNGGKLEKRAVFADTLQCIRVVRCLLHKVLTGPHALMTPLGAPACLAFEGSSCG